jgi:subtilase family serine protease
VTQGDIDVNCGGATACFGATQSTPSAGGRGPRGGFGSNVSYNGALSTSATSLAQAYPAGAGWNFATGLGSVDAFNLVTIWNSGK